MLGGQVVEASRDYHHPTKAERDAAHLRKAREYCAERGLHTVADMRAWLRKNSIGKLEKKLTANTPQSEPGADYEEDAA
jgi:hypothetical protein